MSTQPKKAPLCEVIAAYYASLEEKPFALVWTTEEKAVSHWFTDVLIVDSQQELDDLATYHLGGEWYADKEGVYAGVDWSFVAGDSTVIVVGGQPTRT